MACDTPFEMKILLKSSDGALIEVEENVAILSSTVKNKLEDPESRVGNCIPLPHVTAKILKKVFNCCEQNAAAATTSGEGQLFAEKLENFDAGFINVDVGTLCDLINAADYLKIHGLLDLLCQTAASLIKDKTPAEIRETFKIKSDYTSEEEEKVLRENAWAFE